MVVFWGFQTLRTSDCTQLVAFWAGREAARKFLGFQALGASIVPNWLYFGRAAKRPENFGVFSHLGHLSIDFGPRSGPKIFQALGYSSNTWVQFKHLGHQIRCPQVLRFWLGCTQVIDPPLVFTRWALKGGVNHLVLS